MASKVLAGRYELLEKRGDGGMAVVYKAKDRLLNRFVAIKILKPEFIRDPKFVDSFRRESQAAAGLSHPNVVSVYDVGKEGNIYYIVMEMMEGATLSDIIQKQAPLSEKRVIEISRQIASALSAAHKRNIIHRDIKPHNIIFTDEGVPKIADFGIAKAVNNGTIVNSSTTVLGSVHYLSPEQAKGGFVDAKSDIYSLGIVMYEMLTGSVPFDGENAVSVAMMHINGDVPAPSLENPAVSPIMDSIVLKAAARMTGDRFASADELISALDNAAAGIPMAAARNDYRSGAYADGDVAVNSLEDLMADDQAPGTQTQLTAADEAAQEAAASEARSRRKAEERKKNRRSMVLGIVLALICALPLSLLLLHGCSSAGKTIEVPDVVGMTEEEAQAELEKYGLEYKLGIPAISEEYEEGQVISSDPEAGEKVKEGYTITLILSRGTDADTVKVPNLVSKKLREAETVLESYDLKKGKITYEASDLPEGYIISQDPEAGTEVDVDTEVNLVVSQGDEGIEVPDLSGKTRNQAEKLLTEVGLKLGKVSEAYSSSVDEGLVISQTKDAGSSAEDGDSVGITISKGAEPSAEPVDIPLKINYSSAANEVFTLTVTVTDSNGLHYIVNNQSRIKSDGGETVTLSGTGTGTVRVIMDNDIVYEATANFDTGELS